MDGLIKGLIDVALGGGNNNHDQQDNDRDERSRSSWAEVVSGDQEDSDHHPQVISSHFHELMDPIM